MWVIFCNEVNVWLKIGNIPNKDLKSYSHQYPSIDAAPIDLSLVQLLVNFCRTLKLLARPQVVSECKVA